jgi:DNA polymerase-3 subunit gamma/tau
MGDLKTLCDNFKKFIKKESAILGAKIDSAEILSYENDCLTMGFPKNYIFLEELKTKAQKEKMEQIARDFFQKDVAIKIATLEAENGNANGHNGHKQTNGLNDIKREAMNQPLLQKIMDEISDAKIIEINVRADKN